MPFENPPSIESLEQKVAELERLIQEKDQTIETITKDNKQLTEENKRLAEVALTDERTGLLNTRGLKEFAAVILPEKSKEISEKRVASQEEKKQIAILILDIDHFKKVNDTLGHPAGDSILKQAAGILQTTFRDNDIVSRYGGEEFAIICEGATAQDIAAKFDREKQGTSQFGFVATVDGKEVPVTFSGGITQLGPDETIGDLDAIIKRADQALYQSKNAGRNRITIFEEAA